MANKIGKEKSMGGSDYEKGTIINLLRENINPERLSSFYQEDCLNYAGKTSDTHESYSDVIAEYLLGHIDILKKNSKKIEVKRTYPYNSKTHKPKFEKCFAKGLKNFEFDLLGEIIDYEIPIKSSDDDKGIGDVDLLAYNSQEKLLSLVELKLKRNKADSMLHTILQIYTYYHQLDKEKLKKDFGYSSATIQKTVLIFKDSRQHNEFKKSKFLKQLAEELEVKVFVLEMKLTTP
jgi:hypothetical protein